MLVPVVPQWMHVGFGFFPEDDQAELNVTIEAPPGSNIEYTRIKADEVTRQIRTHKEVQYAYTTIGGGADRRGGRREDVRAAHRRRASAI